MKGGNFPIPLLSSTLDLDRKCSTEAFQAYQQCFFSTPLSSYQKKRQEKPEEAILGCLEVGCSWKGDVKGLKSIHFALSFPSKWKRDFHASAQAWVAGRARQLKPFIVTASLPMCPGRSLSWQTTKGGEGRDSNTNPTTTTVSPQGRLVWWTKSKWGVGFCSGPSCLRLLLLHAGTEDSMEGSSALLSRGSAVWGHVKRKNPLHMGLGFERKFL